MIEPYKELMPSLDLHVAALEQCVMHLGPAFAYDLEVGENLFAFARQLARQIAADSQGNPFAPYLNIRINPDIKDGYQWIVSANGKRIGACPP